MDGFKELSLCDSEVSWCVLSHPALINKLTQPMVVDMFITAKRTVTSGLVTLPRLCRTFSKNFWVSFSY